MPEGFDTIETASLDELRHLQLSRLKAALRHAYDNVAPYRAKCQQRGVHPDDLKQLADLRLFPFTTKQDFRTSYPFGMFAVPTRTDCAHPCLQRHHRQAAVVGYTKDDLEIWADLVARTIHAAAGAPAMVHIAYGYGLFTGGLARITAPSGSAAR